MKRFFRKIRHLIEYAFALSIFYPIRITPLPVLVFISRLFGGLAFYLVPGFKKLLVANISTAFPEKSLKEVKRIVANPIDERTS